MSTTPDPREDGAAVPRQKVTADDIALEVQALYESGSLPGADELALVMAGKNRRERAVITGFFRRLGTA